METVPNEERGGGRPEMSAPGPGPREGDFRFLVVLFSSPALPLRTLPFPKREAFRREWSLGSQQPGARASSFQTRCDLPVKRGETPWMPNRKDSSDTCLEFLSQETTCEKMESTPKQGIPLDKSSKERAERDDPWDYSLGEAWEYDVRVEQKKYNQERPTRQETVMDRKTSTKLSAYECNMFGRSFSLRSSLFLQQGVHIGKKKSTEMWYI
ncbi:uncharacterized protein LOC141509801 [Macrotis lagotis]|uniref:uncharacterized protein LOC141509801 n=1 Tax=Macrotis lagotis TaxID=92651 RepID=UPI003D68018A